MTLIEELHKALEDNKIIPFLKKLNDKDKKKLVPELKKLHKKHFKTGDIWNREKESNVIKIAIQKAIFVCCNRKDAEGLIDVYRLSSRKDYLQEIISWFRPTWYNDIMNEAYLEYDSLIEFQEKSYFEPSKKAVLRAMNNIIYVYIKQGSYSARKYDINGLYKYKETIEEHIWFFFEEVEDINWIAGDDWRTAFCDLILEGKISRERVIKNTLRCIYNGYDIIVSGWFAKLLEELKLNTEETITHQEELLNALNSDSSKVINVVLSYFKKVASHKDFQKETFVEQSALLINSETKSIVTSCLMILDKIGKSTASLHEGICINTVETLLNPDEKIQIRAAKLIHKYAKSDEVITIMQAVLQIYKETMYSTTADILKDFLSADDEVEEIEEEVEQVNMLSEPIPEFNNFDELLFFVNQSIDNNEPYHIDLLLSLLPKLNVLITPVNVTKLIPILTRTLNIAIDSADWNIGKGQIEHVAAFYIRDYGLYLLGKFPKELKDFDTTIQELSKKLKEERFYINKDILRPLEKLKTRTINEIHKSLFMFSLELIKENSSLDLLSKPTHIPCWIEDDVLIDRIISYQTQGKEIDIIDFQIAVGRLVKTGKDLSGISKIENLELKAVFLYHFGDTTLKDSKIENPQLWVQSVLTRNNSEDQEYFEEQTNINIIDYKGIKDWEVKKVPSQNRYSTDEFVVLTQKDNESIKDKIFSRIDNLKFKKSKGIYQFISIEKLQYENSVRTHDELKLLYALPNNPSLLLSKLAFTDFRQVSKADLPSKRQLTNLLNGLIKIWHHKEQEEAVYLTVAIAFVFSDKPIRELASELWLYCNSHDEFCNKIFGSMLGKLQRREFAPLKRFTDLVSSNLINISKKNNENLLELLDNFIISIHWDNSRGIKKVLELTFELTSKTNTPLSEEAKEVLRQWKTKSLQAIIKKLV